ncbi:MAG: asparagine synthase (glutamine-hydrolyzing) [Flavobacteriales bacterium]
MCGIAGIFQLAPGSPVIGDRMAAALACLSHRGPDDEGLYRSGRAVLGHRRLSIIDTSAAGHQPFTDSGGRYTIVFNGEVFNYRAIRAELESQGHTFHSHTDTEVVLRLFIVKGRSFLHDLNGFFALAIHDAENDTLFVARDRFGVKPLVWGMHAGCLLLGSELRAVLALGAARQVDPVSILQYFIYHYISAPDTVLAGVRKLAPGHCLVADANGVVEESWYDLVKASAARTVPQAPEKELFALLDDAVRLRLIADVPVGTFLSGGLDSSIVSALARKHDADLHTFSIGYADNPYFDETRYAEEVAQHIGSEHTTFTLTREDLAEGYIGLLRDLDEPFADSSALPSYILCKRTRQRVTVALSGDGADEVFGGYRKHQAELRYRSPGAAERAVAALAPLWRALPRSRNSRWQDRVRQLDRFARIARKGPQERWLALAAMEDVATAHALAGPTGQAGLAARERAMAAGLQRMAGLNGFLLSDVETLLPNDMLYKVDLTSMAHGLEVRTPFLDKRVVGLAFALPADMKFRRGSGKYLLRTTFGHLLPRNILTRPKKGFEVPLRDLLLGPLSTWMDDLLRPDLVQDVGLSWSAVQAVRAQLSSASSGQAQATVHALLVYLSWWKAHQLSR